MSWYWVCLVPGGVVFTAVIVLFANKAFDDVLEWIDERRQAEHGDPTTGRELEAAGQAGEARSGWHCLRCGLTTWGERHSAGTFCAACGDWTPGEVVTAVGDSWTGCQCWTKVRSTT